MIIKKLDKYIKNKNERKYKNYKLKFFLENTKKNYL